MKAKLIFDLPEEADEYTWAVNGWKYHTIITEMDEELRRRAKYQGCDVSDEIRGHFKELISEILDQI